MVLVSLVDAGDETEAVSVSDGSSKLNLIWSKTSYARGHPYTVIDPGTMHAADAAAAAAALYRLTHSSIGFRFIYMMKFYLQFKFDSLRA